MTTQQLMELYKHETGATEIEMFDFDSWLLEKQMIDICEKEIRHQHGL